MSNDMINADAFKRAPSAAFHAVLGGEQESLADGIGASYGVVGYKGKNWSLRYRGERYNFLRPDDGTPLGYLDVIILRQAKVKSKSYYPEGSFQDGQSDGARPVCASLNGEVPDADVQEKQADACALCPRNAWRQLPNGRKGRECSDYKRLAVLILPNVTKAAMGSPLIEPVFLRIPAASLNGLATFGENMRAQGWHFSEFITRITFDPNKPHPEMIFRALQPLTDAEAPVVLPLREDPLALRVTGEDSNMAALAAPARMTMPPQGPVSTGIVPSRTAAPAVQTTAPVTPVQPVATVTPTQVQTPAPATVDAGFGSLTLAPEPAQGQVFAGAVNGTVQPVAADVGLPGEADADLDAQIANLLKVPA